MAEKTHQSLGDVSCRATGYSIQQLQRMGLPTAHLTRDLAHTLDDLQSHSASIPWDDYLVFLRNSHTDLPTDQLVELCTSYKGSPHLRPLLSAAGLWFHPARYFQWVADPESGAIQQLFRCVKTRFTRVDESEVVIEEAVAPGFALPPDIFWETQSIAFGALTTHFGMGPSIVTWEPINRGAAFRVRLPRRRPIRFVLSWLASWFRRDTAEDIRSVLSFGHERSLRLEREIAERKTAEAVRRDSEERFRRITDAVPGIVYQYYLDPDGGQGFIFVSGGATAQTGYTPEELIDRPGLLWERIAPEDIPGVQRSILESARNGAPWQYEFRFRTKAGDSRWVRGRSIPEPMTSLGRVVWNGILTDVTAERLADEQLRARDALLNKLSEQVPGFIYQYQQWPDGRSCFPYASDGIRQIYEVAPEDVRREADAVFGRIHPDDFDAVSESIRHSLQTTDLWHCEYRVRLPKNGIRWLDGNAMPERMSDGSTLWHGYIRDVTDRKLAEDAIRESENRFRTLIEDLEVGVVLQNASDRVLVSNQAAATTLGLTPDQLHGVTSTDPDWELVREDGTPLPPDQVPSVAAARSRQPVRNAVLGARHLRNGQRARTWLQVNAIPRLNADGSLRHVLVSLVDITERKRAEEALRARKDLYMMLAQTNRAVSQSTSADKLYGELCEIAVGTGRFLFAWVGVPDGNRLKVASRAGNDGGYLDEIRVSLDSADPRSDGPACRVMSSGLPVVTNDFFESSMTGPWRKSAQRVGVAASAGFPLMQNGQVVAVFSVYATSRDFFTTELVETLGEITPGVSFALDGFAREAGRRAALEALQTSEERWKFALEGAQAGVLDWDIVSDHINFSDRWRSLTGFKPGDIAETGEGLKGLVHPDDLQAVVQDLEATLAGNKSLHQVVHRLRRADGQWIWIESRSVVTSRGQNGAPLRMIGTHTDISERKRGEDLLRFQNALLQSQTEASPDGILIVDPADRILSFNKRFLEVWGIPEQLTATGDDTQFLARARSLSADPVAFGARVAAIYAERESSSHDEVALADGRTLDRYSRPIRSADNELLGRVWYFRDISERKQALRSVEEAERRQRLALDASQMGTWDWNIEQGIVNWDSRQQELFGFKPGAYDGNPETFFTRLHPDDVETVRRILSESLQTGRDYFAEFRVFPRPGVMCWIAGHGRVIRDDDGRPIRVVGVNMDLTESKKAIIALQESERRHRLALDAGRMGTWDWEIGSDRLTWDDREQKLFGFQPGEFDGHVATFLDHIHPDDLAGVHQVLAAAAAGQDFEGEFRIRLASGEVRWIHGSGAVVPQSDQSPPRLVGINYDVTERKRAEETVRQILDGIGPRTGREFFRVLVDYLCQVCEVQFAFAGDIDPNNPNLVRTIAVSHRGQVADNFTYDLRGTPCDKVVGHTFCSFPTGVQQSFPDDAMLVDMGIDGYLGTPLWSNRGQSLGIIVLLNDRPIPYPEQAGVVLKVVAARAGAELERQQADAALRESEERLRIFVENAPAGVAMLDRDLRYVSYSHRWLTDYGLGDQNLVGRSHYEVFPEVTNRWKEIHGRCLSGMSERCEQDRFVREDGTVDYLRWEIQPWADATGAIGGLVFFTELITDRVKAEEQVRASLREKEAMLKEIHHRVKNNLQVISSLLSLQSARVTHPVAIDVLTESQNRVRAMALVHETLYRSEDFARVDLARYLGELCGYLFRSYGVDSTRVRLELDVESVAVSLDKTIPCGLIVNEIISNSLKYAFPGNRCGTVTVRARVMPDGNLNLILADDGVGLPDEVVVDRTPSLGLQLVNILTEQLGGRLTVERSQGARFSITFAPTGGSGS